MVHFKWTIYKFGPKLFVEFEFELVRKAYLDQNERMNCLVKLSVTHVHVQTSKEIKLKIQSKTKFINNDSLLMNHLQ